MKLFKQILIIIFISILFGFVANALNPKGIPLVMEKNIYKTDTNSVIKNEEKKVNIPAGFKNDPYDTNANSSSLQLKDNIRKLNKKGFYEPLEITSELAKQFYEINALFIDARHKEQFDSLHVKGAINIPYIDFYQLDETAKIEMTKKFNKNGIIVVYCSGGKCDVSIDLAYELAKLGFNSTNIYKGGILEWKNLGYPVEGNNI